MTLEAMLKRYQQAAPARFHMPGHKGILSPPLGEAAPFDITEVAGADSLYAATGVIAQCENRYAQLYGSGAALLSAGGATLCIQGMLAAFCRRGDSLLAGRNAHVSAIHTMALLGLRPRWLFPPSAQNGGEGISGLALPLTPALVEAALAGDDPPAAVYLTSPDYAGQMADIAAIAGICHSRDIPLLVDNAHGAHLRFLETDCHPITLGADACTDSLHKTLPVLTGGALLHLKDGGKREEAKRGMALFGSTSPSYLIMLSAEQALGELESGAYADRLFLLTRRVAAAKQRAARKGFALPAPGDPARLTVGFGPLGYTGESFGRYIRGFGFVRPARSSPGQSTGTGLQKTPDWEGDVVPGPGPVEPEYIARSYGVFLPSVHNTDRDWSRLEGALEAIPPLPPIPPEETPTHPPEPVVALDEAAIARPCTLWPMEESIIGRVAAQTAVCCPPGTALVVPGERIDASIFRQLKSDGIPALFVLK